MHFTEEIEKKSLIIEELHSIKGGYAVLKTDWDIVLQKFKKNLEASQKKRDFVRR